MGSTITTMPIFDKERNFRKTTKNDSLVQQNDSIHKQTLQQKAKKLPRLGSVVHNQFNSTKNVLAVQQVIEPPKTKFVLAGQKAKTHKQRALPGR